MRKYIISFIATAVGCAFISSAAIAQTQTQTRRNPEGRSATGHGSNFYIKGPNAPFKNQQRKLSDPLNANGAGK